MPAVLAGAGTMSLIVLGVIAIGALLLGVLFGQLTKRVPNSDGGCMPTRDTSSVTSPATSSGGATGSKPGPVTLPSSHHGCSTSTRSSTQSPERYGELGIALVGLWVPAIVNLVGVRQMAWFQNITVVLKFLPLLFVGVVGWFFVHR